MSVLSCFDLDGTLFKTKAKTIVLKNGKPIRELDDKELQHYKLKEDESFDWSQFESAEFFYKNAIPIKKTLAFAKGLIDKKRKSPTDKIIVVTARPPVDNISKFLGTFRKHGLDTDQMKVERVGDWTKSYDAPKIARQKTYVIKKHLSYGQFNMVQMFEDNKDNLRTFIKFSYTFPHIEFNAYHINSVGNIIPFK